MSKANKVGAAVASVVNKPTVQMLADTIYAAAKGGRAGAVIARQLWGDKFATEIKPRSVEREAFNGATLRAWTADPLNKPRTAVRVMGEYRYAEPGEQVPEGSATELSPGFVMQYKGNALTKLKKDSPTLGKLVDEQKTYFERVYADAWRNLKDADAALRAGETDGRGSRAGGSKPFGERFARDIEERFIKPNRASFERGDTTAFEPSVFERGIDAMMNVLKKG